MKEDQSEQQTEKKDETRYMSFDKELYLSVHQGAVDANSSLFNLLNTILGKCFSLMFYLNGGAAVAVLAFVGAIIKENKIDQVIEICELKLALTYFAIGTLSVAICTACSYLSQSNYCAKQDSDQNNLESMIINHMILPDGGQYVKKEIVPMKEITGYQIKGDRWRYGAIGFGIISFLCFLAGVYFLKSSIFYRM